VTVAPERCDLILKSATVLTLDARRTIYSTGAIAVRGHTVAAVGPEADTRARRRRRHRAPRVHRRAPPHQRPDLPGLLPGGQQPRRPNYADWKAALRPEDEQAAAALGCLELLRQGYTAFVEPGSAFEPDAVAAAARATGVRCSLADPYLWDDPSVMDVIPGLKSPSLFARVAPTRERALRLLGGQLHRNRDPDGTVHGHVALYGEGTASDELLRAAKALADREGVVLNSHLGFDLDLAAAMEARWGRPRFVHLAELGVLGPNATFVHMNVIRDGDVPPILESGLSIVWCPLAYLQRGTPLRLPTRIPEIRRRGGHVALGTDSARQSAVGDAPFLAIHLAAEVGHPIRPEDAIEMATLGAARAAGLDRLVGSLEPGKRADIVVRQRDAVELGPGIDPAHQLVTIGHGPTADTVLVNGRVVLEGGRSTRVSEVEVIAEARASVGRMAERLGLGTPGRCPRG
jgi:5-methylthioadenosine/S-adenosylhomocysteine deaminase